MVKSNSYKVEILTEDEWMARPTANWGHGVIVLIISEEDEGNSYQHIGKDISRVQSMLQDPYGKIEYHNRYD